MYQGQLPTFLLAVDTETSGCNRGMSVNPAEGYQVVSLGLVIIESNTFSEVERLYIEVKHDPKYKWEMGAEKVHGLSREYLEKNGVTLEEAAYLTLALIQKYMGDTYVLAVGHRVMFDIAFLNAMFDSIDCGVQWDRMIIDSSSMGAAFLGISGSEALFQALGLPERQEHNAMEDICYTVESIRRMRETFMEGLHAQANGS